MSEPILCVPDSRDWLACGDHRFDQGNRRGIFGQVPQGTTSG